VDIENLLDRRAGGHERALRPAMTAWLNGIGESEAWFAAQGPFDWTTPEGPASGDISPAWGMIAANLQQSFTKVDGALLTLSLQSGYSLSLKLQAAAEQEVDALSIDVRRGWEWLKEQAGPYAPQSAEAAARFEIHGEGPLLTASVHMPQEEVEEQIRKQLLQRTEQLKARANGSGPNAAEPRDAAAAQPNPRPSRRAGIRIEGLAPKPPQAGIRIEGLRPKAIEAPTKEP
jgi:hypothetical protein